MFNNETNNNNTRYSLCVSTTSLEELVACVMIMELQMHIYKGLQLSLEGLVQRMRSIYLANEQGLPLHFYNMRYRVIVNIFKVTS